MTGSAAAASVIRLRRSTRPRRSRRPSNRAWSTPSGGTTSRTRKPSRFGLSGTTKGAYFAPRKFGPPERDIDGIEKYEGRPWFDAPRSWATTDPRLGWKLTNAPQPTGILGGAPVIM